ncbi:MAG: chemotaxis protein CheB [Burkholderiales bacterium]
MAGSPARESTEVPAVFGDATMTRALIDRLTRKCHFVETGNESYRFRHSAASARKRCGAREQGRKGKVASAEAAGAAEAAGPVAWFGTAFGCKPATGMLADFAQEISDKIRAAARARMRIARPVEAMQARLPPAGFARSFAERLNKTCPLAVKEAEGGERVLPGHVYIARGNRRGSGRGSGAAGTDRRARDGVRSARWTAVAPGLIFLACRTKGVVP